MSAQPGQGRTVPSVVPLNGETEAHEALQARTVLQAGRSTERAAQRQSMQRRAATCFQIRLIPHVGLVPFDDRIWQVLDGGIGAGFLGPPDTGISLNYHDAKTCLRFAAFAAAR